MPKKRILALLSLVFILVLACDFSSLLPASSPEVDPGTAVAQAIVQTQLFQTQVALSAQLTVIAAGGGGGGDSPPVAPPVAPPVVVPTNTPAYTPTPSTITVTVSVNTNCRTGPGSAYPIVGALAVGQVAEVIGRSAASDNWIVKLPGSPTVTCWLWGQYATVVGNTAGLTVYTPPPTPTPTLVPLPTTISITIYNDCGVSIFYAYISLPSDPWGIDELGSSTISVGSSFTWTNYPPDTYDVMVEDAAHVFLYSWYGVSMLTDTYLVACP